MPKYSFKLKNGKTMDLEGDTMPSDEEVESLAKENGVELMPADTEEPVKSQSIQLKPEQYKTDNTPIETDEAPAEAPQSGWLSKAWHTISDPLTDLPSRVAKKAADYIDQPSLERSPTMARIAGFGAGALQGIGDAVSGLTSPINLATAALTGGGSLAENAGYGQLGNLLKIGGRVAAAPVVAHGTSQVLGPSSTMGERAMGLTEIAGGLAGMRGHTPTLEEGPITKPGTGLSTRVKPLEGEVVPKKSPEYAQWTNREQVTRINEGRDPLTGLFPENPTPSQRAVRASYERKEKFNFEDPRNMNDYGEEGGTPEITPDDITKREAELKRLKEIHSKNVNRLMSDYESGKLKAGETETATANETPKLPEKPTEKPKLDDSIIDEFKTYRELPVGTKLSFSPAQMSRQKMSDAMKLGFKYEDINEQGKIVIRKVKESPEIEMPDAPENDRSIIAEAANLPRTLMASIDLSAPLRQGLGLIHKKEFWKALPDMVKAGWSEDAYQQIQKSITDDPMFKKRVTAEGKVKPSFAEEAGLKLTDLNNMAKREESIMSSLAEKVPGVRPSNRAYTVFLNKLRADTFKSMTENMKVFGVDGETNIPLAKDLAEFINAATGRGSLGKLEPSAKALSTFLFSPRLIASRLQMMTKGAGAVFSPETYMMSQPSVRREYLKSLFAIAAVGNTITQLGRLAGGKIEKDPASADFGKLHIGNTRIDPYGGFQQYIVAAQRLMPHIDLSQELGIPAFGGRMKSTQTQREYNLGNPKFGQSTRADTALRFLRGKTNPIINFGWGLMAGGKELSGKKMQLGVNPKQNPVENLFSNSIAQRFIPMLMQDVYDLYQDKKTPLPAKVGAGVLSGFGMGSQTYGNR
jgi:hypothetical protein